MKLVIPFPALPAGVRPQLLRRLGAAIGPNVWISGSTKIIGTRLSIGADSYINTAGLVDCVLAPVTLGSRVDLGHGVKLITTTHQIAGPKRRAGRPYGKPIVIGDGTWIGAGATVLPGITIGAGCLIAAGAVVSRDCAPNGLYAGVPARRIRELDTEPAPDTEHDGHRPAGKVVAIGVSASAAIGGSAAEAALQREHVADIVPRVGEHSA